MNVYSVNLMFFLLLHFAVSQAQPDSFAAIKVGMKDDQVEKLVGLPMEIFKGFTELSNHDVKTKGQLNYVCWRYKKSKRIVIDTSIEIIEKEIILGVSKDTIHLINDTTFDEQSMSLINDTVYFWQYEGGIDIISKESYYHKMEFGTYGSSYQAIPARRSIRIETHNITKIDTSYLPIRYVLIFNQCILFDSSSNRVVNVDYYPTIVVKEKLMQKKKKIK